MVHGNWLLNIVAHVKGGVGAVLIRAVEPIQGIEILKKRRNVSSLRNLTSGPGKLTKAFAITKDLNGIDVAKEDSPLVVMDGEKENLKICSSHRIGVKADLPQKLRFFIDGSKFVS